MEFCSCILAEAHGAGALVSDHDCHHIADHRMVSLARGSQAGSDCNLQLPLLMKSRVLAPLSWNSWVDLSQEDCLFSGDSLCPCLLEEVTLVSCIPCHEQERVVSYFHIFLCPCDGRRVEMVVCPVASHLCSLVCQEVVLLYLSLLHHHVPCHDCCHRIFLLAISLLHSFDHSSPKIRNVVCLQFLVCLCFLHPPLCWHFWHHQR